MCKRLFTKARMSKRRRQRWKLGFACWKQREIESRRCPGECGGYACATANHQSRYEDKTTKASIKQKDAQDAVTQANQDMREPLKKITRKVRNQISQSFYPIHNSLD